MGADVEAHQLSIGVIGYRSALFSGDGFDNKLIIHTTFTLVLHYMYERNLEGYRQPTSVPYQRSTAVMRRTGG